MYNQYFARVFLVILFINILNNISITHPLILALCGDIHPNPGPHPSHFKICHINARSLTATNRLEEIEAFITFNNMDIACITETHIDATVTETDINIDNYSFFRCDRNRNGGGVGIYVNNNLTAVRRLDLELNTMEVVWIELIIGSLKHLIACCYRPPGQSAAEVGAFLSDLQYSIDAASSLPSISSISLLGDFNDRCTDWNANHTSSELGNRLRDLITYSNLHQLIHDPTRDLHILDLIITNSPNYYLRSGVIASVSDLDHDFVFGEFVFTYTKSTTFQRHICYYDQSDYDSLNNTINNTTWDTLITDQTDLNHDVDLLTSTISDAINKYIPSKTITIRPKNKPGYTSKVKKLYKECQRLHKKTKDPGSFRHSKLQIQT